MPKETRVPDLNQYHVEWLDSTGEGSDQVVMFTFSCIYSDITYYPLIVFCLQCFYVQDIPDVNWDDEYTQRGLNTRIQGSSHDDGDKVKAVVTDFFGEDVIGPSFIPKESQQPYAYNYASGLQQGLQTPPPMQESQTQEDQLEYGRGLCVTRPPNHLLLSGPKGRPGGHHRLQ